MKQLIIVIISFLLASTATAVEKRTKIDTLDAELIDRAFTEIVIDVNDDFRKADKGIGDAKDSAGTALDTALAALASADTARDTANVALASADTARDTANIALDTAKAAIAMGLSEVTANDNNTYDSLFIGRSLTLDYQESAVDQGIYFYYIAPRTEYLLYDYGQRFILSDDLTLDGDLRLNGTALDLNYNGPSNGDQYVYFWHGGARQKWVKWSSSGTRFEFNDDVYSSATIESGTDMKINGGDLYFGAETLTWSGTQFELSDDMEITGNLTVSGDIDVDGNDLGFNNGNEKLNWDGSKFNLSDDLAVGASLTTQASIWNGGANLYMKYDGAEGDQAIYFREDASNTGEYLKWDNGADEFRMSDDLHLDGGSIFADYSLVAKGIDVYIGYDAAADGNRIINFNEGSNNSGETFKWDNGDDRFELTDELFINGKEVPTIDSGYVTGAVISEAWWKIGPLLIQRGIINVGNGDTRDTINFPQNFSGLWTYSVTFSRYDITYTDYAIIVYQQAADKVIIHHDASDVDYVEWIAIGY